MTAKCVTAISVALSLAGCLRAPQAKITDQYIEITKPGHTLGIVEVIPEKIDSTFGYPSVEREIAAYSPVERESHETVEDNTSIKIYFEKPHQKYCWKIHENPFKGYFHYTDTFHIKPFTWYRLNTEYTTIYLYWKGVRGDYITKYKSNPGAW